MQNTYQIFRQVNYTIGLESKSINQNQYIPKYPCIKLGEHNTFT
jgi:hypothetical protein